MSQKVADNDPLALSVVEIIIMCLSQLQQTLACFWVDLAFVPVHDGCRDQTDTNGMEQTSKWRPAGMEVEAGCASR